MVLTDYQIIKICSLFAAIVPVSILIVRKIIIPLVNTIFPTKIILWGLQKEQKREVIKAWQDMSSRYPLLKKLQSGIYVPFRDKKHKNNYGYTDAATAFFVVRENTFIKKNHQGSSHPEIMQSYYDYTVHELTHALRYMFSPYFKNQKYRLIFSGDSNDYKNNLDSFIVSVENNYNISDEDLRHYLTHYGENHGETLSECMWLYYRLENNKELQEKYKETYRIAKIFVAEFDLLYKEKTT